MTNIGHHAVVLGASMSGLLTARVLADFYDTVTLVERDLLPVGYVNRRGVPQGRHVHALLAGGADIMEELFPGLLDELEHDGTPVFDADLAHTYLSFLGHLLCRTGRSAYPRRTYVPSRPFLEGHVRRRLRALANVTVLDGHDIAGVTTTAAQDRVTGARVADRRSGDEKTVTADLVVDATGRGSRTPAWLERLGYGRPAEEQVVVKVAYVSQLLRIPAGTMKEKAYLLGACPGRPTGMALFGCENDTWMFTVAAVAGVAPPDDPADMVACAEGFLPAQAVAALRDAEPLEDVARHGFPANRWHRYDKMRRFPAGLLVIGDAVCRFNPTYGQGMSVAALEAKALRDCLRQGKDDLARRFFKAATKPISVAWQLAVGGDLALPEIEGPRQLPVRLRNAYVDRLLAAAEADECLADMFMRVAAFLDPPSALLRPSIVCRVIVGNRRRRHRPSTVLAPRAHSYTSRG
ncbi:MAG: FAD-dependent monooxygenase [Pseudonocardia sp.]|nr:FAD-dependent monooxygenase [Pseudonocardia sp.]